MYVCICHPITDKQIKRVLEDGAQTTAAVLKRLEHKIQCGKCVPYVRAMVNEHKEEHRAGGCTGCGQCGKHEVHTPEPANQPANQEAPAAYAYGVAAE